ncbi:uncharacterized protein LOC134845656 isoform X2 [Symsagittifera roscoffensis]|uniref:uncharacterized protein LOC134845656 isoform X2 n=1 Tax=Symsagittifera roscoffensis TaxID=84072 RepID=UPI00307B9F2A
MKDTLQQHKHQLKQRIDDNGKFISEQFNKQLRAEAKYKEEHRAVQTLEQELAQLEQQAHHLNIRLQLVSKEIENGEAYRTLLLQSAKIAASSDRGPGLTSELDITNLIQKHQTLQNTNNTLKQTLKSKIQEKLTEEVNSGHEIDRLNDMLQLDTLQTKLENTKNKNHSYEQTIFFSSEKHRQELIDKGKILQAIDNLLGKCRSRHFKQLHSCSDAVEMISYPQMLEHIQEFILHEYDVIHKSRALIDQYSDFGSRRSKRKSVATLQTQQQQE